MQAGCWRRRVERPLPFDVLVATILWQARSAAAWQSRKAASAKFPSGSTAELLQGRTVLPGVGGRRRDHLLPVVQVVHQEAQHSQQLHNSHEEDLSWGAIGTGRGLKGLMSQPLDWGVNCEAHRGAHGPDDVPAAACQPVDATRAVHAAESAGHSSVLVVEPHARALRRTCGQVLALPGVNSALLPGTCW